MGIWGFLASLLVGILILQYLKRLWSSRNYPPGPFQLPLIGGLWKTGKSLSQDNLMKLAKQYGNIFTIWMGPYPVVVLSGYQTVKEGLINRPEDFAERPVTYGLKVIFKKGGVLISNGHIWKEQRRFAQVTLRKLGLGKKHAELIIQEEAHGLVEIFARAKGHLLEPVLPITTGIFNVICAVVFGHRFYFQEEQLQEMMEQVASISNFVVSGSFILYEMFPQLMRHLLTHYKKVVATLDMGFSLLKEEIARHKEHQTYHDPQDFADFYLLQMEKTKSDPKMTYNEDSLAQCIADFLLAGTETTSATLQWALLLMAVHPDIQDRVYKEMEDVLGTSQSICYQDWKKLPYTNAVIHEILRANYVLPIGIPRRSTKDVNMQGYTIPKGTYVIADLSSVLLDPKHWDRPEEFNPHHFLDKDGHFVAREEFLAFGGGLRVCLGEHLARMELFLFFTHLLRAFKFKLPEGEEKVIKMPMLGFTLHPKPFKIYAVPRYSSPKG